MFHPLAYTKTFALVGVALLSITLVPALIPIFLKGRIKSEDENWLVRTMIEIFKPMLAWLMDRTTLVCWLFVIILGLGYVASTKLGREFMPDLNEQSLMDMPTTVPRASIAEVERDLRVRDEVLRGFPEVWQVVGKAGRAETPTDAAPLDMIETVINLRDHDVWPKRKLRFEDAVAQTRVVLDSLEAKGLLRRPASAEEREGLVSEAAMTVASTVDEVLRDLAARQLAEFRPELGRGLVGEAIDVLLSRVEPSAVARKPTPAEREALIESLAKIYGDRLAVQVLPDDVTQLVNDAAKRLIELGVLRDRPDLLTPPPSLLEQGRRIRWRRAGLRQADPVHPDGRAPRRRPRTPAQGTDEVAQLGALRPRRRCRQLVGHRRTVEAGPRPEVGRPRRGSGGVAIRPRRVG